MLVAAILQSKGTDVHTIAPDQPISAAVAQLSALGIGALVVSSNGRAVEGILSERDVVHGLAQKGADLLGRSVSSLMTSNVHSCSPDDTGRSVLERMTERRIRHVPVLKNGELCGLVSIGDVVKSRLEEVAGEAHALREYIAQA